MSKYNFMRISNDFKIELDKIKIDRIKMDMDKEPKSYRRITQAIIRHPSWQDMKIDIEKAELPEIKGKGGRKKRMNRKAQQNLFFPIFFLITVFVFVLYFGIFAYGINLFTEGIETVDNLGGQVNATSAIEDTFGAFNTALIPGLKLVAFGIIFGLIMFSFLSSYFLEEGHPVMFVVYFITSVVAVVVSVYVSNAYQIVLEGSVLGSTLTQFTIGNHVLLYLPLYTTIVALGSLIFLFVKFRRAEFV